MLRAALACAAVIATASLGFSLAAAAPPQVAALGDSYMAGVGAGDYAVTDDCRRSARSYAADATRRTASALIDESCPGARIPQVLQQASLVPAGASFVLVQVGGNDVGFSSIAIACLVPQGGSCLDRIAESEAALPAIGAGLQDIARAARTRAPRATIVFAGYPSLLSGARACASSAIGSLLNIAEIRAIIELQRQLDATIAAAAKAAGARYIDWPRAVDQHSLCSPSPWFVTPFSGDPQDSLHPTAKAYANMGRSVADLLRR